MFNKLTISDRKGKNLKIKLKIKHGPQGFLGKKQVINSILSIKH